MTIDTKVCPFCSAEFTGSEHCPFCTKGQEGEESTESVEEEKRQEENIAEQSEEGKGISNSEKVDSTESPNQEEQNEHKEKKDPFANKAFLPLLAVGLVIAVVTIFLLINYNNEKNREAQYMNDIEAIVTELATVHNKFTATLQDNLKDGTMAIPNADFSAILEKEVNNARELQHKTKELTAPERYKMLHTNITELLNLQKNIYQDILLVIQNPLNQETDAVLVRINATLSESKELFSLAQVDQMEVLYRSDLVSLTNQLSLYVEEERRIYREKLEKLEKNKAFFERMDAIQQRWEGAKTDLQHALNLLYQGDSSWFDYYAVIDDAKRMRRSIRDELNLIPAPTGLESMKNQLHSLLTDAVYYCELMERAGSLFLYGDYYYSEQRYDEAKALNRRIQNSYGNFKKNYQVQKSLLTNLDNL
ncbi:hypothetical protein F9B85_05650 [Heliorestis acidaminivorans]|uniref:Uncharacterized protein n=1 Tax=Heliorestis acidaminivorans TaxID=553427 RepID=A0A6I0F7M2_9FIRM|nr:hypothetical protein [Heliorestis acidaminivorans]KAB2953393.1 hypothetical protein F9B85_05650 [Heliorestis acidaminivorans]